MLLATSTFFVSFVLNFLYSFLASFLLILLFRKNVLRHFFSFFFFLLYNFYNCSYFFYFLRLVPFHVLIVFRESIMQQDIFLIFCISEYIFHFVIHTSCYALHLYKPVARCFPVCIPFNTPCECHFFQTLFTKNSSYLFLILRTRGIFSSYFLKMSTLITRLNHNISDLIPYKQIFVSQNLLIIYKKIVQYSLPYRGIDVT